MCVTHPTGVVIGVTVCLSAQFHKTRFHSSPKLDADAYVPVPVNATFCGLPPPLSFTSSDAERFPFALGVNVT
jgi:hypothetical protein